MTPKEEVRAALLNNADISKEAAEYLDEILSGGASGGGGVEIFEMEWYENPNDFYDKGMRTVADAQDLADAFTSGKQVRLHFTATERSANFSINGFYVDMLGYTLGYTDSHSIEYKNGFLFNGVTYYTPDGGGDDQYASFPGDIAGYHVDTDGKLCLRAYID